MTSQLKLIQVNVADGRRHIVSLLTNGNWFESHCGPMQSTLSKLLTYTVCSGQLSLLPLSSSLRATG